MDTQVIEECTRLSLSGAIAFPEVVKRLAAAGVERYRVDVVGRQKMSYGHQGESFCDILACDIYPVAEHFSAEGVKAAILDSQHQRITYPMFLRRIMEAGCSHYEVFLDGRKAVYVGRDGNQHIELFPVAV